MKPSPSKPTVTKAIVAIGGTILTLAGATAQRGPSLLDADVKETVAPTLIDARRRLRRYRVYEYSLIFLETVLQGKARNEWARQSKKDGATRLGKLCGRRDGQVNSPLHGRRSEDRRYVNRGERQKQITCCTRGDTRWRGRGSSRQRSFLMSRQPIRI